MSGPEGYFPVFDHTAAKRILQKVHELSNTCGREFGKHAFKEVWLTGEAYDALSHLFLSDPRSVTDGASRWRNGVLEVYTQEGVVLVRRER